MNDSQIRRIENLEREIRKVEDKIDRLLTHRKLLAEQIVRIKTEEPKVQQKPTDAQRREQSERDKAAHQQALQRNRSSIQRLSLD